MAAGSLSPRTSGEIGRELSQRSRYLSGSVSKYSGIVSILLLLSERCIKLDSCPIASGIWVI